MEEKVSPLAHRILFLNTLAFTVCFAVWMFNGVMVTFLADKGVFNWTPVEIGWLIGIPVLTGSVFRLPIGILTDKYGGKWVFGLLLLFCSIPMFFLSMANNFWAFAVLSFGYGMAGTGFAVGIAYTSVWYPQRWQGRALGIFGVGNAGAAITTLVVPTLLNAVTDNGKDLDQWRKIPIFFSAALIVTAILFLFFTVNKKPDIGVRKVKQMLQPLREVRVWRFGLYYFLVFGCFVAFSQWLVPFFVNVYATSLVVAGLLASIFSFPSGIIRALGGWLSDKYGGRKVMKVVFELSVVLCALLVFPRMEVFTPGEGVTSAKSGTVTFVSDSLLKVGSQAYIVAKKKEDIDINKTGNSILPVKKSWQTPIVREGDEVKIKQLLAQGETHIYYSANMWMYAMLVFIVGILWGIGKAGVYKFIPDYFPNDVGAVGGMVGVIGGLGGFVCPILFGYLLELTGLWTSCWMLMLLISLICFIWMNRVIAASIKEQAPDIIEHM